MDDLISSIKQIDNFNNGNKYDIIKTYINRLNMKDKMCDEYSYLSEMHLSEYLFDYFNVKKMNSITKSFIPGYKNYYFVKEFFYEFELDRITRQESFNSIDFNSIDFNSIDFDSIDFDSIDFNPTDFDSIDFNSIDFDSIDD